MNRILNQKMKQIFIRKMFSLFSFLKKIFFFNLSEVADSESQTSSKRAQSRSVLVNVRQQRAVKSLKSVSVDQDADIYCTKTLRSVVIVEEIAIIALIDSESKINLMNESTAQLLRLQMRLNSNCSMITQTCQSVRFIDYAENVSVMIDDIVTYTSFMIVEYEDQDFILRRS